ncbi:DUF58 domain-containing protein [Rhodovastum atsumiense]|uniref:DUF58 domain-containing protein n=1 Tax=Rhodovastum atsumiense TaxID=504468 RepID=A0A5M6IZG0_9PROT|nr:DUF58 domain-containing protein [Rhodovastum atsumiense]KAA5612765.1 DUF58 domain-containing protein [Rhodovastum atsumiense]CAH2602671.1 DUF58 domain-containing protein [Rhodovastum atsumiense]
MSRPPASARVRLRPTAGGIAFALLLPVCVLVAINAGSNAVFALAFLLAGVLATATWQSRTALAGLRVEAVPAAPTFAGGVVEYRLRLRPADDRALPAMRIIAEIDTPWHGRSAALLQAGETRLSCVAGQRGWLPPAPVFLVTLWPLGLMRARLRAGLLPAVLVYPRPAPPGQARPPRAQTARRSGDPDTLSTLRPYVPGDRPGQIAWKALARSETLLTRQFDGMTGQALLLEWDALAGDTETRLSWLTRQVLDCALRGESYGLRLPGTEVPPGSGPLHQQTCLRALALHQLEAVPPELPA